MSNMYVSLSEEDKIAIFDMDDDTGKADKARSLGVKLMTPEMFKTKYSL